MKNKSMEPSSPVSSQSLPPGTRIEEFVIERVLGSGGFGITYLATDTSLGRQVVIKENLPVQFCFRDTHSLTVAPRHSHGEDADNFQWSLENFSKESAMLASLDHPGIVKVLRSFQAFGTAYFVMPYVDGMALDTLFENRRRKNKPFAEDELRGLLERVLGALAHLHDRGIYHRDIKPGNILITNDGIPVLIDFGSARQRLSERSMTVVESAGYTPFEQLQSRGNVGPWSDLYSLAATVVKMITGETLPKANDRVFEDPWVALATRDELLHDHSAVFLDSIDQALALHPRDRWQDAGMWLAFLAAAVAVPTQVFQTAPVFSPAVVEPPLLRKPSLPLPQPGEERDFVLAEGRKIRMCWIPQGEFLMGSPESEAGRYVDEKQVEVTLSQGFWMAKTVVTQAQWQAVMERNPSRFKGANRPVESVSWNDAQEFLTKVNRIVGNLDGEFMVLPTEAQWEYAARAGETGPYSGGTLDEVAWYIGNSGSETHPVGTKKPNAWGLNDIHGNVLEWCADWYGERLTGGVDPQGAVTGVHRAFRGGSWNRPATSSRAAFRFGFLPNHRGFNLGFRPALVPS
jgi:formylglycine-generating enzyme required for sulfatase activity